jgi:proline iminopeptidase
MLTKTTITALALSILAISPALRAGEKAAYLSGKQLQEKFGDLTEQEHGFFVPVPIDYKDLSRGKTEIYAYFRGKPYDPSLPTYAYVHGGPGGNSHDDPVFDSMHLKVHVSIGYNVLFFDQRGSAYSRPDTEALYNAKEFYSSESSARDLEEIRKFVGIDRISLWGTSYGTVVSTIYGHLFPQSTRAIVLEGTVFAGAEYYLGNSALVPNQIQKFLDSLAPATRQRVIDLTAQGKLPKNWFPVMTFMLMGATGTHDLPLFSSILDQAAQIEDGKLLAYVGKALGERRKPEPQWKLANPRFDEIPHDSAPNEIISAQELGTANSSHPSQKSLFLEGDRIVRGANLEIEALKARGFADGTPSTYRASDYALSVPVSYIQGVADSATPAIEASLHYKRAAKGPAQILLLPGFGHTPSQAISRFASYENSPQWETFRGIFRSLVSGEAVSPEKIAEFNAEGDAQIKFAQKGFSAGH